MEVMTADDFKHLIRPEWRVVNPLTTYWALRGICDDFGLHMRGARSQSNGIAQLTANKVRLMIYMHRKSTGNFAFRVRPFSNILTPEEAMVINTLMEDLNITIKNASVFYREYFPNNMRAY